MKRVRIKEITKDFLGKPLTLCGWVRTVRRQKNFSFIEINDGSSLNGIQVIMNDTLPNYESCLALLSTGAAVRIEGVLITHPRQSWELQATSCDVVGPCPAEHYPLQKKKHSFEFLRTIAHLRARTLTQGAILRIRNLLFFATHQFFQQHGFLHIPTPILTALDCEGGGEQFKVTSLNLDQIPKKADGTIDFSKDLFHKPTYLTVSGQLEGEAMALALSRIYTFGPTFRAEPSNTYRHLAEFWMIEPEIAFADLQENIQWGQNYLKHLSQIILKESLPDLEFLETHVEQGLLQRLAHLASSSFSQITYTQAIQILETSKKEFSFPVAWGKDLQSEHERYLTDEYFKSPVVVTDYPASIKPFYMRLNSDEKTVAAMDLLVPKIGELIGGSQREERYERLRQNMIHQGLNLEDYNWYLQLRQYGGVPHSGFGVGFERLVQLMTGVENIRDVVPFPRYPGHVDF